MERELARIRNLEQVRSNLLIMIAAYEEKGFTNCANLVKAKAELTELNLDLYREKYPQYLFFTDENFDEIVKRNKLAVVEVDNYIGSIPDYCWKMIETENIDKEDLRKSTYNIKFSVISGIYSILSGDAATMEYYKMLEGKTAEYIAEWMSQIKYENGKFKSAIEILNFLYDGTYKGYAEIRPINVELIEKEKNDGLYIAAPRHMTTVNTVKKFPHFLSSFHAKPLDPIVFRKVNDGILVITFWK